MQIQKHLFFFLVFFLMPWNEALSRGRTDFSEAVPGEYVLKRKALGMQSDGRSFERIAGRIATILGSRSPVRYRAFMTSDEFATFVVPGMAREDALAVLKQDPEVAYAEPNLIFHALGRLDLPSDPQLDGLWGLRNFGQKDAAGQTGKAGSDIRALPVWNEGVTGSRSIRVAVIDTGVDDTHPDLQANVDAANGYNFVNHSPIGRDDHNHGTHCAGTIGAVGNNGKGVVGVNWNVTIIPLKFLDAQGSGTLENAIQAIQYATRLKVNVMSNSWGGGGYTQSLYDAIDEARKAGILFVAAAGNESNNNDERATYPAGYVLDNVISVAATDNQDKIAGFSNYGARTVHVAAPGVKILSTLKGGGYGAMSGTSMATPHVAGMAALLLSVNPSMGYRELKEVLIRSSDPVRGLSRKVISKGRVNLQNALHRVFPVPSEPDASAWRDVPVGIESSHPYGDSQERRFEFRANGARWIRVVFDRVDLEAGYDFVELVGPDGGVVDSLTGAKTQYISEAFEGDRGAIVLRSDSSVNRWGFQVSKIQAVY